LKEILIDEKFKITEYLLIPKKRIFLIFRQKKEAT